MSKNQFGLIGLAVMGQNLVLNAADHGFRVSVFNRTAEKTDEFMAGEARGKSITATYTKEEFVDSLERPRTVQIMVKAGGPVDDVINQLKPLLDAGDIIIDGGNSFFPDTERRARELESINLRFIGMGVSGGEEGARYGPSLMPGGTKEAYTIIEPLVTAIAAKAPSDGAPCVTFIGPGGAGHYVKMVHNGIEYGDMQLISESYAVLKAAIDPSPKEFHQIFSDWNAGELSSFLIEITADIFCKMDDKTGKPLVDLVLDKAGQKGTGKWTSQNALDIGAAIPTITAAVDGRILSSMKEERVTASKILFGPKNTYSGDRQKIIDAVRAALYASKICSYAQGMALLKKASSEYGYGLNLPEIARIWRAGCIIRARLLDDIMHAYRRNPTLPNLLMDDEFKQAIQSRQDAWRFAVKTAIELGIPVPAMSASLAYFDAYRSERLPANLIQAQRDYFGAHTFERIDQPGVFHANWKVK
ncbi:MAG: NADP-dependent phosphogluconate dehydrogenase [Candidatus Brocadia sp. AMX2]|uniref:6-phosphogluconate dehydrogenase, decarboxylating n=1 Tax=Candidatus Brocadia sinica JPN1 TaxID=1197129 RepID=A0ABQ0JSX7_9BACT|nr:MULTISPECIES: NADP-dependent phosphogluconate dehydrogenase [Brocadia]KXK26269.1 MAG: 6-phosphogluconate dehydrogenase (decarboxylating) [Candidatus Brocadia sinica]MBC6931667.1 NADP-dependent phosphogluconate dehydrogenase [Candidatus Brocadia sp.]MBL1168968.1 NADP-dependent phosphogluconate dehydrogenase [Candidatus Brocadia sp. AMX1]NOG43403.1 NADP-dependent phosphogluconate dehydrogenase [Planctomycetota bacterium]KAA0245263.1 MAG: NADP-dependent phosphogluconate dehydrogenase [Candidat